MQGYRPSFASAARIAAISAVLGCSTAAYGQGAPPMAPQMATPQVATPQVATGVGAPVAAPSVGDPVVTPPMPGTINTPATGTVTYDPATAGVPTGGYAVDGTPYDGQSLGGPILQEGIPAYQGDPVYDGYGATVGVPLYPRISVYAGLTLLSRTNADDRVLIIDENTFDPRLSSDDIDFDYEPGLETWIRYALSDCSFAEVSYLGLNDYGGSQFVTGDNSLSIPGDLAASTRDFLRADEVNVDYLSSNLHRVDLNLHRAVSADGHSTVLAGVRYLNLQEELNLRSTDFDTFTSNYNIQTNNNLVGPQVGVVMSRGLGRLRLDAIGRVGIFANFVAGEQTLGDVGDSLVLRAFDQDAQNTAFIGDVDLVATLDLTRRVSLRAGYQAMYVAGVALAPEQFDTRDVAEAGRDIVDSGNVLYHGLHGGIEFKWGTP